jgi:arylsulfatase A-like enzyme
MNTATKHSAESVKPATRPNIILFTVHDLGDFTSPYGHPVATPNFERFARQGVVCENHFTQGAVCSPSRGCIVTGCYPHTHGLMGLVHRGWALDTEKVTPLPSLLRSQGYETHLFGFQHEHYDPAKLGYGERHPMKDTHADTVMDSLVPWLQARAAAVGGRGATGSAPFFAAVGTSEVHRMGMNPSGFKDPRYTPVDPASVAVPPWMPDIPEIREDLADFYGCISFMDSQFGRMLDALDAAGLAANTLVVFTTDHGASFIHGKGSSYDGGVKVAQQWRFPGVLPTGKRCSALTAHVDFLPTMFELLGFPVPAQVQGRSFLPQLLGQGGASGPTASCGPTASGGRDYVFGEKNYTNSYEPTRWARNHRYKYIRRGIRSCVFDFLIPELELQRADFRRVKAVWDFYSARRETEELFDLEKDPGELRNLLEDPAYAPALAEMRRALNVHLESVDDPFRFINSDILPMPRDTYREVRP